MTRTASSLIITAIISSAALLSTSGCGLIYDYPPPCPEEQVELLFDWSEVGDPVFVMPEGMTMLCYPTDGEDYWRYETTPEGGSVGLPYNSYNFLAINNDTRSINHIYEDSYKGAMAYTADTSVVEAVFRAGDGAEPPHPEASQPIRQAADKMYVAGQGDTIHDVHDSNLRVTLYPRLFTPDYRIIIDSIENLGAVSAAAFALSGLSGAKYLANGKCIDTAVAFPGTLAVSGEQQLTGNLINFGPASGVDKNILCVYVWLRNNEKFVYMYDVTDQIASNADKMSLTIRAKGFKLPEIPETGDNIGNINIGIDNWINVDIDLTN